MSVKWSVKAFWVSAFPILSPVVIACFFPSAAFATEQKIQTTSQPFAVKLGATRVIYDLDSDGATLAVNNPQDYPMLVQSKVVAEDKQSAAPFIITPPLFRLEGQQQSQLRIVRIGGEFARDRESLQWLCVKGVPPKKDDAWMQGKNDAKSLPPKTASLNAQVSVSSCIKLLLRPAGITGNPGEMASSLTWQRQGEKLLVNNPTAFYMNLGSVKVGGSQINMVDYVPPFASRSFELPKGASGLVQWQIINDYGGQSMAYKAELK